jgi:DNA-binding LacI/PurR family transcriptional regulator
VVDVARAADVSVGTVSNVVSGARNVRPETRERVERAIAELGFRPNTIARALIRRRTQTVGMVIPDVTNPFFSDRSGRSSAPANDLLAMGVLASASRRGLAIPGDISVSGYDDIAYAAFTSPPLTTVRQPARAMGEEAVRLLLLRLEGDEGPPRRFVVEPELRVRASTGPPSVAR